MNSSPHVSDAVLIGLGEDKVEFNRNVDNTIPA
jgi:hypothetical protein